MNLNTDLICGISAAIFAFLGFIFARRRQRNPYFWSAISLILPPSLLVLVQLPPKCRPINLPRWTAWIARIIVVTSICLVVTWLGDDFGKRSELCCFQSSIITAIVSDSSITDTGVIKIASGQTVHIANAFRPAFALAALGSMVALFVFRRWLFAIVVLASAGFLLGAVSQTVERIAFLASLSNNTGSAFPPNYFPLAIHLFLWFAFGIVQLITRTTDTQQIDEAKTEGFRSS